MDLTTTRTHLHGVAELLMAGPQYRQSGTIRLRSVPGGFATVAEPALAVDGALLAGLRLSGTTFGELAAGLGLTGGAPDGLYADGSGLGLDDAVRVEEEAAFVIARGFALGDAAARLLAPGSEPVLWPEHFDLGITLDEVNYGVSAGDASCEEPYAYVGPWQPPKGTFWNVPFGAARPLSALPGTEEVLAFFAEGRELLRR
ncbi:MAG: hypothetical protein ABIS86_15405 [Streptosporangiaceae bacterium]